MNTKRKVKKRHFSDVELKEKISSDQVKTLCEGQNYSPMVSSSSSKSSLATLNNDTNIKSKLPKPDNKDFVNNIEPIETIVDETTKDRKFETTRKSSLLLKSQSFEESYKLPIAHRLNKKRRIRALTICEEWPTLKTNSSHSQTKETSASRGKEKHIRLKKDGFVFKQQKFNDTNKRRREHENNRARFFLDGDDETTNRIVRIKKRDRILQHQKSFKSTTSEKRNIGLYNRGVSFSPQPSELSLKLRSLTNVLLNLRLSHSLNDINTKLEILNSYLKSKNRDGLSFSEIKSSLVTNIRDQQRSILLNNSDNLRELLLLLPGPTSKQSTAHTMINNQLSSYENAEKLDVKMPIVASSKPVDDLTKNTIFSRLLTNITDINNSRVNESPNPAADSMTLAESQLKNEDMLKERLGPLKAIEVKQGFIQHICDDFGLYHSDDESAIFQAYLLKYSPTLKRIFTNFLDNSHQISRGELESSNTNTVSFEDLALIYKCTSTHLAFKRSFSTCSRIELTQRYIKKSRSFEKFLVNVVNGKKKSESMQCSFNHQQQQQQHYNQQVETPNVAESSLKSISSVSIKHSSSSSSFSSNLEAKNPIRQCDDDDSRKSQKTKWPLLKINDSLKGSSNDLSKNIEINNNVNKIVNNLESDLSKLDKELEENSESYIPTTIRDALESAGININEIINMKKQLEMSLGSTIKSKAINEKSDNNLDISDNKTNKLFSDDSKNNTNTKSNQVVSVSSNLKSIDIKQNISAKISEQVENAVTTRKPNGRKKSNSQNRYATVYNFISPQQTNENIGRLAALSSNWMTHSEQELTSQSQIESPQTLNTKQDGLKEGGSSIKNIELPNRTSMSSLRAIGSSRQPIVPVPPIILSQFKPIVNIHKRTNATTPLANLINSASTDSFLNLIGYSSSLLPFTSSQQNQSEHESYHVGKSHHKSKALDKMKVTILEDNDNHAKVNHGGGSVSRSFSYNIDNIVESSKRIFEQQNVLATTTDNKSLETKKDTSIAQTSDKAAESGHLEEQNANKTDGKPAGKPKTSIKKSQSSKAVVNKSNTVQIGVPLTVVSSSFGADIRNGMGKIDTSKTMIKTDGLMSAPISQSGGLDSSDSKFSSSSLIEDSSQQDFAHAKRKAIVVQMYDTEKSYVEALKILVQKYYLPLKEKDIVERNLINDIFYKIPEIHVHHELLLSSLKSKYDAWDTRQTIGDILLNIFAKQSVIETYISFVNNYRTSQEAIRISREQSNIFSKFIEQQAKDHRGKLTLKDLIIQPVQRIPRYELYIKDFLKCTPTNHPDYQLLMKAQKEVHNLAEKIDQVHKEVNEASYPLDSQTVLQTIQDLIENLDDFVTPYRYYIRHDMVTITSSTGIKKDRCIFLFSDSIILTSCKRRSTNVNKKINSIILNSPIGKQYLENIKHKFVMKLQIEDIDLTGLNPFKKLLPNEKDYLEEDLNTITRINELVKNLSYPHHNLEESLKDITANILRQINESTHQNISQLSSSALNVNQLSQTSNTNNENVDQKLNQLVLLINTTERVEIMTIVFSNFENRNNWEKCFVDTKKNFFKSFSRKPASFLHSIAIPKNRSGVQFTCASARRYVANDHNDLWICSTDGQMGQVCIVNTIPDLAVTSCNTVCSARITCIQCVPPYQLKQNSFYKNKSIKKTDTLTSETEVGADSPKQQQQQQQQPEFLADLDSDSGDDAEEVRDSRSDNDAEVALDQIRDVAKVGEYNEDNDSKERDSSNLTNPKQTLQFNFVEAPTIPTLSSNSYQEIKHSTMWIGNDDGSLHIFQFNDSAVRTVARKNRITKQFSAGIDSLAYMDNKVFVSLKNGEIVLFKRIYSIWNYDSYAIKAVSTNSFNSMINVAGKLWCTCENSLKVLNPNSLDCEHTFTIDGEKSLCLAAGGNCTWAVWIACINSLDLKLYHATKYILLAELNIRNCICQKLNCCEELIRLHKMSCLKISSIYVCKDTLWVGTSAGLIVNIKIPFVNNVTTKLSTPLIYNVLNHGHVGPVRFITSVDIPKQGQTMQQAASNLHQNEASSSNLTPNSQSTASMVTNSYYRTVVITGGEGYDEYKSSSNLTIANVNSVGISLSNLVSSSANIAVTTTATNSSQQQQQQQQPQQLHQQQQQHSDSGNTALSGGSNTNSNLSGSPISANIVSSNNATSILDDAVIGKEDLVNYILTWET